MDEGITRFLSQICRGSEGISLNVRHDYGKYISSSPAQMAAENWQRLGENMKNSVDKVLGEYGEI